jgi:hypothetical protein
MATDRLCCLNSLRSSSKDDLIISYGKVVACHSLLVEHENKLKVRKKITEHCGEMIKP